MIKSISELKYKKFISRRQKFVRLSKAIDSGLIYSLKSIINEFSFAHATNPFKECLRTIFTQRRKLGVVRKKEKKVASGDVHEIMININIIKGRNIPIRESSLALVRSIANKKKDLNYKMALGGYSGGMAFGGYNGSGYGGNNNPGSSYGGHNNPGFSQHNLNMQQQAPGTGNAMHNPLPPLSRFMRDENIRMIATAAQNSNFILKLKDM